MATLLSRRNTQQVSSSLKGSCDAFSDRLGGAPLSWTVPIPIPLGLGHVMGLSNGHTNGHYIQVPIRGGGALVGCTGTQTKWNTNSMGGQECWSTCCSKVTTT